MAKKVPVVVFVDPTVESQLSIKPFAAGLATKPQATSSAGDSTTTADDTTTGSATGTNLSGNPDVDADVDFSG